MGIIFLLVLGAAVVNAQFESYILGGQEAEKFKTPFIASLQIHLPPNFVHVCSGVVLAPR